LLEKSKAKEISEEKLEKELKKFEDILIEKREIAKPLFMNFDWFRRYYKELIRKSGKRVANIYLPKKTREFLTHISGRIEQLENKGSLYKNAEKFEEFLEKSFEIREKWALQLKNYIHKVPNKEISKEAKMELETIIKRYCEIRAILFNNNILKEDKEKLIQGRIKKCIPRFSELFEILIRFLGIYDEYSRKFWEKSLILEGKKAIRQLSQKLESIKKERILHRILYEDSSSVQNLKEILKENLYQNITLSLNEKSTIIKIIQKNKPNEDKNKLISILGKLTVKDLISLLGEDFKEEDTKNYSDGPILGVNVMNKNNFSFEYEKDLKKYVKIVSEKVFPSEFVNKLVKTALSFFEFAKEKGLTKGDLGRNGKPGYHAILLIYFSCIFHEIKNVNKKKISARHIGSYFKSDLDLISIAKSGLEHLQPRVLLPFLPERLRKKVVDISHPTTLSYDDIFTFVESKNLTLKTTRQQFHGYMKCDGTKPSKTHIVVNCGKHDYPTTQTRIQQDFGCPTCWYLTYDKIKTYVESRGYTTEDSKDEFVENSRKNRTSPSQTKFNCKCPEGHPLYYTKNELEHIKICPNCSQIAQKSYVEIKKYFESRSFPMITSKEEFLENKGTKRKPPTQTYVTVKCTKNHNWTTTYNNVKSRNVGCPKCSGGKYEKIFRWYMERIFTYVCGSEKLFPQEKLRNIAIPSIIPRNFNFNRLHFDAWNRYLLIRDKVYLVAGDFHGEQHDKYPNFFDKLDGVGKRKFQRRQITDQYRRQYSNSFKIIFLEFWYYYDKFMRNPKVIQKTIVDLFKEKTGIDLNEFNLPQFDHTHKTYYRLKSKYKSLDEKS